MRVRVLSIVAVCVLSCAAVRGRTLSIKGLQDRVGVRRISWADLAPLRTRLEAKGITAAAFPEYVGRVRRANVRRVREGDLDHLVFYLLQSTHFTSLPPIEPALSAKALVESLDPQERDVFSRESRVFPARIPSAVRARVSALIRAFDSSDRDPRLSYFRELAQAAFPRRRDREWALIREYLRTMRFVYEKEFVAQRSPRAAERVAELYRTRGLSTDSAVEAGYLVYLGLGIVKALAPDHRIRRVLIVGPGLDLAPRTALREDNPPQSYQPWAVMDALLTLGLSRTDDLTVVGADINPRVVNHLRRSATTPPMLALASEIRNSNTVSLTPEYREYFNRLGRALSGAEPAPAATADLSKNVRVDAAVARTLRAETLDIVIERLQGPRFDLVIATNILPYFDDVELTLALTNIAAMLAPGGVFLHNEGRPLVGEVTSALGLAFEQSRHATIATVRGAPPLGDSVWIHRIPHR